MKIGILSDTHINFTLNSETEKTYSHLILVIKYYFQDVDHIIHAGDVLLEEFIHDLEKIAPTSVVRGNMDFISKWPKILHLTFEGVSIVVAHEPQVYFELKEKPRVFIHGHTHYPRIQETHEHCLIVNPGSLTQPRHSPYLIKGFENDAPPEPTLAILEISQEMVSAFIKKIAKKKNKKF
ncbi:MAG: metallophosphatase family protein [Candidatus Lokiarchaeota archaeon]|nr:metallophosphatase family protein [Candidatus Harpocratesius repetitus]